MHLEVFFTFTITFNTKSKLFNRKISIIQYVMCLFPVYMHADGAVSLNMLMWGCCVHVALHISMHSDLYVLGKAVGP